ncbi:hypothetical protein NVP1271B_31 [Vibrio phage 1.271.B._10N.286.54.B4]|nr:hypothetical protein NVP1027O_31 [Vibrio phage 1.027.O._10N.286.54.B8]AUR92358.1 hypothetical protein NVP1171O_31 [Vibrio phage 1.171.O._10N.261.52.F12]AUR94411.1 hypothetical protein NVP1194O_31 [Vibrio phage 1.194.O._10N.286.54.B1]AUR94496.1 hypothetical protein NVP1195O_31 [Vibrio phage 1.195.O._10N.286.54.C8]AUR94584.1 hypothetical protein NVP1196O_31 [Vibrio phage 1.196.O._10N.286.54.E12]AUR95051.1 hypothetical protein NVP1200O_31 [Vibrio phage 1.200.O._10N.286.55.E1]AUR99539.1 hypoth
MTSEEKVRDAREFTSLLLSCELAVEFNKDKPNKAIKHTLRCVQSRVTSPNIKRVAQQGLQQIFPQGWLQKQLNNVGRIGGLSRDEFLRIGASL